MNRGRYLLATTAFLLVGCGTDEPQNEAASPTSAAETTVPAVSVLDITETPTTTSAPVTGLPPVTFVDGGPTTTAATDKSDNSGDRETESSTTVKETESRDGNAGRASSTSTTSTTVADSGSSSSTTSTTTQEVDASQIDTIVGDIETGDHLADLFPHIPPVAGEGTAIRATITPITGLSSGDTVTIEAENLPAGQFLASAQCSTLPSDAADLGSLLEGCNSFNFGVASADGTGTYTVQVAETYGDTDCRAVSCYVGIAVLPGTADYLAFEEISFG